MRIRKYSIKSDEFFFAINPVRWIFRKPRFYEITVAGYSRFRASDFEFSLPRPSYTIHTLQALSAAYPEREFYLIIGADNWQAFQKWKSPEIILEQYHLLIYPRQGYTLDESSLPSRVKAVHSPLLEISSTFIRESLAQGKDIRYFLHPEVHRIIQERKLYQQF